MVTHIFFGEGSSCGASGALKIVCLHLGVRKNIRKTVLRTEGGQFLQYLFRGDMCLSQVDILAL